jgi:hypothetical protein
LRWTGHVARMGELGNAYIFRSENLKGRYHLEDVGLDRKIILEWILREIWWESVNWMHLAHDRYTGTRQGTFGFNGRRRIS